MSARLCLISRYSTPRKFSGRYSWIMNALTSTRSPSVMRPSTTPSVARQIISVTATAMISDWPTLSTDSEVWLRIAARSQRRRLSS